MTTASISGGNAPYAQTAFDNSPLNRPVEQGAPGVPWQLTGVSGGGRTVKMVYTENNSTSFTADSINGRQAAMYYTVINSDFSQTLHANGYYAAGTLTVTVAKDENWASGRAGTVEEYKDIDGRVVLKRQYNYVSSAVQVISTYYVYDDLGRLAFVLPPTAGADGAGAMSTPTLNNLCYQYRYDERGRPEAKRLPGKGFEYTVYNIMDQPVATQDSLQGIAKQWIFTKYDDRQRVVWTGIWNNGGTSISRSSLQSSLNGISTNLWESAITTGNGYTNVAWPTTNVTTTLSVNYYDGYTMPGAPTYYTAPSGADLSARGELTATQTNVLNTSDMLWTEHYYDYWGRSLEGFVQHYLNGSINAKNFDAVTSTYDFTNAPTTVTRKHWTLASTSNPLVTVYNKYIYDWMGRKLKTWEQITNKNLTADTLRLVSNIVYNEIDQVGVKDLHSKDSVNFAQVIGYTYNERGWLMSASSSLFAMSLNYNTSTNKAYNGNIMYQFWGVPGNLNNHYTYKYDKLNRLISGVTSADNYQESGITYDSEGNITALNRYSAGTQVDQLTYFYNSKNSLDSVKDANASNVGLVSGKTAYTYDGNGNMLSAANIANTGQNKSFTYNLLNLPKVSTVPTGTATYTYDAAGNKLRKVSVIGGVTTNTDYIGGIQYNGSSTSDTLNFIQTEEGKAVKQGNGINYEYVYYLGDNLGNTRITFGTAGGVAVTYQKDDYYPFGLEINRTPFTPKNEYLYNKKELQEEFGEYDYKKRYYDPLICRFTTEDSLATKYPWYTPYQFAGNEVPNAVDQDGLEPLSMGNPMQTIAEGFRQYFQAAGADIDSFFARFESSTDTQTSEQTVNTSVGSVTITNSTNMTTTTTASTGLSDYFSMNSANTPMGPLFKVSTTTTTGKQTKVEGTTTVRGVDIKASNTTNVSSSGVSTTTDVSVGKSVKVGKVSVGAEGFVSSTRSTTNHKSSKETTAGVKVSAAATSGKTTTTVSGSVGVKLKGN